MRGLAPFLVLALAAGSAAAAPVDTLTVLECARLAAANAPDVLTARAESRVASADSSAAAVNGRPALSLIAGGLLAPTGSYDPTMTNLGEYHVKAVLGWPLADGGARRRARITAALTAQGARFDAAKIARDAALRAIAVALDLVRTDEMIALQTAASAWLTDLTTLVSAGVESGRRTRADAVRVAIERDAAELARLTALGARGALARELASLIGRPGDTAIAVRPPGTETDFIPWEADSLALLARVDALPDVRRATTEEALRRIAIEESRARNTLQVGLIADAGLWGSDPTHWTSPDIPSTGARLRRDLGASLGLELKQPLVDPARRMTMLARAASLDAARLRREALIASYRRTALDLLDRGRTAATQLELARASVARATENVLRLRSLYAGGVMGLLDVLDARRQLDDTLARLADAQFEARRAHFEAEAP